MTVIFDPVLGDLRLDPASFATLLDLVASINGDPPEPARLTELREQGVLRDNGLHPSLFLGMSAVADPICEFRLRDQRLDQERWHTTCSEGWIGEDVAALVLAGPDGLSDLITLPAMFVPEAIALAVELGPRPRPARSPLRVPGPALATWDSAEVPRWRTSNLSSAAQQVIAGWRRYWDVTMRWTPAPGAGVGRRVRVADSDAGLWLVERYAGHAVLEPATATTVWQAVVELLPRRYEVRERAR